MEIKQMEIPNEIKNFKCSTDGTFEFRYKGIYRNCSFAGNCDIKIEWNTDTQLISKIIECTPIKYDNYYDFCLELAEQIITKLE